MKVNEKLENDGRKYYFSGKCNDTDNGNEIQQITHWDDFNYGKYAGIPSNDDDIEIIETNEFLQLIGNQPKPNIIEYCAYNNKMDILWAYDSMGIHWFYTQNGNYLFEFSNENIDNEINTIIGNHINRY